MLRALQDETGGFLTYIPLAYHPDHNELGEELGRHGHRHHGRRRPHEHRRGPALPRQHPARQDALDHGHAVRSRRSRCTSARTISRARWCTRRSITRPARTRRRRCRSTSCSADPRGGEGAGGARLALPRRPELRSGSRRGGLTCASDASPTSTATRCTAPSTAASCHSTATLVDGVPSALNALTAAGALDVSVVSAVEYASNADRYLLLPDLAITSDGPVRSVLLFSNRARRRPRRGAGAPLAQLDDERGAAQAAVRARLARSARIRRGRRGACRSRRGARSRRTTRGSSSATRRCNSPRPTRYPYVYDLGAEWKEWTGLPFVFAVWVRIAPRRSSDALRVHRALLESRDWGLGASRRARRAGGGHDRRRAPACASTCRDSTTASRTATSPASPISSGVSPSAGRGAGRLARLPSRRMTCPTPRPPRFLHERAPLIELGADADARAPGRGIRTAS